MSCSLKIKYADVEVEFSGDETFAEKHLLPLVQALSKVLEIGDTEAVHKAPVGKRSAANPSHATLTTSTAATKLASKTGTDLVTAAAYVLHVQGKETFTRNGITLEMKGAKSYYKDSYQKNLSNIIDRLVKQGNLLDQGNDTYALSVTAKASLDQKFAK